MRGSRITTKELDTEVYPEKWGRIEDDIVNNHPVNERVG